MALPEGLQGLVGLEALRSQGNGWRTGLYFYGITDQTYQELCQSWSCRLLGWEPAPWSLPTASASTPAPALLRLTLMSGCTETSPVPEGGVRGAPLDFSTSFVFGLSTKPGPQGLAPGSAVTPRKSLEMRSFLLKSYVFLLKILCVFVSQTKRKNKLWGRGCRRGGVWLLPVQHRDWEGSGAPGSRAMVPFSCLGEARPPP